MADFFIIRVTVPESNSPDTDAKRILNLNLFRDMIHCVTRLVRPKSCQNTSLNRMNALVEFVSGAVYSHVQRLYRLQAGGYHDKLPHARKEILRYI